MFLIANRKDLPRDLTVLTAELLTLDQSTPADRLVQLQHRVQPGAYIHLIAHPNCPDELWVKLADDYFDLVAALQRHQLPARRVQQVYQTYKKWNDYELLAALCRQVNGTFNIWRHGLTKAARYEPICEALAENPKARQYPLIRTALLTSKSKKVILSLLEDRRPEEFETLMLQLLKIDRKEASALLEREAIPPGTPFPHGLIEKLLGSKKEQERLLGIGLLSRLEAPAKTNNLPVRAPPATKRRNRR